MRSQIIHKRARNGTRILYRVVCEQLASLDCMSLLNFLIRKLSLVHTQIIVPLYRRECTQRARQQLFY